MTAPGTRRPREGRCERCDRPLCAVTDETQCSGADVCHGGRWGCECDGTPIDWRARALAAEARLSVPATSADTTRLHRIRTRLLELVPADGTMSLWDDVQRLDRALADAEARGRAHGLLAAAWACPECDCSDSWTLRGRHSTECAAWVRDEIAALADNGPPMAACADCDGFGGFSVYGKPSGTIVRPCETCDGEGWLAQEADRDG